MSDIIKLIQETFLINNETISVDLYKFIKNPTSKLFITGFSGSGKTTIGKILAKYFNRKLYMLDDLINISNITFKKMKRNNKLNNLSNSKLRIIKNNIFNKLATDIILDNKYKIIEGVSIIDIFQHIKIKNIIMDSACIFIGKSIFNSSLNAASRDKQDSNYFKELFNAFYYNYFNMIKEYNHLKQIRMNQKNATIELFNIKDFK